MTHRPCPTCRRPTQWENNKWRPFCSERCRLLDLGGWASESYGIPEDEEGDEWSEERGSPAIGG
ncbi:MAG: DNA gyrase inhibitor YacG [Holophagales bacterium]|jgi:endogenous inhibitor of DNA gyrase (YacG/DUF329 family)|nr:DNA gyrase inhibitor YacG [Holophagales bacterium]